jgi:hypothetical protein
MIVLSGADQELMESIHDGSFPLPNLDDPNYICKATVVDGGIMSVIVLVRRTTEATLICNSNCSLFERGKGLLEATETLKKQLRAQSYTDVHAFVRQANVEKVIKKLGFEESISGKPLVLQL